MRIALICPSSSLYMPYVSNYVQLLKDENVKYDILSWERFHVNGDNNELEYRDEKIGHQRNYIDYLKFKNFVIQKLREKKYDKLIIFGLQLTFFLRKYLLKNYKGKYVIDIRDHHKLISFMNKKKIFLNSKFIVISSSGYKKWLPISNKYVINHNTQLSSLSELKTLQYQIFSSTKVVSCIGAIRDYDVNIRFINSLKNKNVEIYYHGNGDDNEKINNYIKENKVKNVHLTGRYFKEQEEGLYTKSHIINVLREIKGVNNKTALPNRLYNAVIYGKPLLALEGTYMSVLIKKNNLGLVIDSFENMEKKIEDYIINFNQDDFREGRISFINKVIDENDVFYMKILDFVSTIDS